MSPILGTKKPKQVEALSVEEAHTLWRILADRYTLLNHFNELRNFAHDTDFVLYLEKMMGDFRREAKQLEEQLSTYSVPAPRPNAVSQNTVGNSEVVLDQEIATTMYTFLRLDLALLINSLKDTAVNEKQKSFLLSFAKRAMERVDTFIKYVKLKNWLDMPPQYPSTQPDVKEKIAANEVFLLWEHLEFRYSNIRLGRLFSAFAADPDFTLLLARGVDILDSQAKEIEKKLLYFGVTLPKPYTPVVSKLEQTELLEDAFMYNKALRTIKDGVVYHGAMLGEAILNDELRSFFTDLVSKEIDVLEELKLFGKDKGWIVNSPTYKAQG